MDKSYVETDLDLKAYATLTILQGQICLQPGFKHGTRAFIQCTRDMIRTDHGTATVTLPAEFNTTQLMRRYTSHTSFVYDCPSRLANCEYQMGRLATHFYQLLTYDTGTRWSTPRLHLQTK